MPLAAAELSPGGRCAADQRERARRHEDQQSLQRKPTLPQAFTRSPRPGAPARRRPDRASRPRRSAARATTRAPAPRRSPARRCTSTPGATDRAIAASSCGSAARAPGARVSTSGRATRGSARQHRPMALSPITPTTSGSPPGVPPADTTPARARQPGCARRRSGVRPRGVSSCSSRAGHRASRQPALDRVAGDRQAPLRGRFEQPHRDDGVVHLVPARQRQAQRTVAPGRRGDRDLVASAVGPGVDARRRRARRPAARARARATASTTSRASSGSGPTTTGTPGLIVPAFSPAIAESVVPN